MSRVLFRRISLYIGAALMMAGVVTELPAAALDRGDYESNDVLFYDPNAASAMCSGSSTTVSGDGNIAKMWNYFIQKGLNDQQAAGVLGNIQEESGFSPTRQQDGSPWPSGGWGIVQWTGGRRTAIVSKIEESLKKYYAPQYGKAASASDGYVPKGVPVADNDKLLAFELDYLYQESTTRKVRSGYGPAGATEWEALKTAKTIREASDVWLYSFERPGNQSEAHAQDRAENGEKIFATLKGTSTTGPSTSGTDPNSDCAGNIPAGDLAAYVKSYAWPDYKTPPFTDKRPDYEKAVKEAQSQGLYVGGNQYPGVDCGGFVTLLLRNSGFEPGYNYSGKGGNTVQQEAWVKENWTTIGKGNTINTGDLRPGDVAFRTGHTFVFVGDIPGFNSKIASASLGGGAGGPWRAPMAGKEDPTDSRLTWYRKK